MQDFPDTAFDTAFDTESRAARDSRRRALGATLAMTGAWASLSLPGAARAQSFPSRPVRLVVPFPAGGPTDIVARPLAALMSSSMKEQVIVDNRGGAGGAIAAEMVAKAAPDGYTLLMGTVGTQAINFTLYKRLTYNPASDFTPIALVASGPVALVVPATSPYRNVADFLADAKRQPGNIVFGTAGNGTPGHLTGVMFSKAAGIELRHVPYRGSAPALTDLLGSQIPSMFDPLQSVLGSVRAGKLRALAISGKARSRALPNVPTMSEAGVPGFSAEAWWGVYAPARLPEPITQVLVREVERAVRSDDFRDKLGAVGIQPTLLTGQALIDFNRMELGKWSRAVRESGASLD